MSNEASHDFSLNSGVVFSGRSSKSLVYCGYVSSKSLIIGFIDLIKKQEEQVKPREEGSRQINVLLGTQLLVVSSIDRVSCC